MRTTIIIVLLLVANYLVGQNYFFSDIENPNLEKKILITFLFDTKAFAGGIDYSLYYNGEELVEIFQPTSSSSGDVSGFEKENGDLYAFQISSLFFHQWNNSITNWEVKQRPGTKIFSKIFVLSENNVYFCAKDSNDENYNGLWYYDGSEFTELVHFNYSCIYRGIYVQNSNNILLVTSEISGLDSYKLLRFNGSELETVYIFPNDRGAYKMTTNDGNTFFFLSSNGDIYKWNDSTEIMEQLYTYSEEERARFSRSIFAIDNNNIFVVGYGGIRHLDVATNVIDLIWEELNESRFPTMASYCNGRAFIVTLDGRLIEMTIASSISSETIEQLAIYPNPAICNISIEFPVFGINDKTIEILDFNGRVIKSTNFSSFKVDMDISGLSNGVYFLKLSCEEGIIVKKFIKTS